MMRRAFPLLVAARRAAVARRASLFTVEETQWRSAPSSAPSSASTTTPGLHWKWPWDQVVKFDRRILSQSYTGETFLTNDNRGLIVDFYIKWRVKDPSRFYFRRPAAAKRSPAERLSEIVKDGIKSVVAQRTLEQIVSSERAAVTGEMFGQASSKVAGLGVDLIDVRVQRIDLPDEVAARVYESMKQNFAKIASRLRAEGQQCERAHPRLRRAAAHGDPRGRRA